jgi:hypothetical protein
MIQDDPYEPHERPPNDNFISIPLFSAVERVLHVVGIGHVNSSLKLLDDRNLVEVTFAFINREQGELRRYEERMSEMVSAVERSSRRT